MGGAAGIFTPKKKGGRLSETDRVEHTTEVIERVLEHYGTELIIYSEGEESLVVVCPLERELND